MEFTTKSHECTDIPTFCYKNFYFNWRLAINPLINYKAFRFSMFTKKITTTTAVYQAASQVN